MEEDNNKLKDAAKLAVKVAAKKIGLTILIPVVIFLCLQAVFTWFVTHDDGTWGKNKEGNPSTYTKSTKITAQNGIDIDKNTLIKNILLSKGFSEDEINELTEQDIIRILGMSTKLGRVISSLDECTKAELLWCSNAVYSKYLTKPEHLQKLLDAELITQYPKIDGLPEGKLNGIIEFVRYETNPDTKQESVKKLQYIDNASFESKFNSYQQNGSQDIFNYFTLTENGEAKVATWTREEGQYSSNNTTAQNSRKKIKPGVTTENINSEYDSRYAVTSNNDDSINAQYTTYYIQEQIIPYKNMVQKYTLPFEYLWSLLVMGKDEEFVLELADLAYNSEIKIGLFDNITETTIINEETYTEDFKERYELYRDGDLIRERAENGGWETETYDYNHKNIVKTYSDTIQIELIYADTWSVKTVTEYENSVNEQQVGNDVSTLPDEDWQDDGCKEKHWTVTHTSTDSEGNETETEIDYDEYLYKHKRTINQKNTTIQNVIDSKYQKISTTSTGKVDKNIENGKNFVNLLINTNNAFVTFQDISNVNWLEDILLGNEDTKGLVDLTKYLIKEATGNTAIDVSDFNFDVYNTSSYSNTGTIYGSNIHEKVWFALRDAGYSEYATAGAMGNIEHESGFNTKCVQGDWRQPDPGQYDQNYTDKVNSGEISENDFVRHGPNGGGYGLVQWTYWSRKQGLYNYSKSLGVGIDDEDMQINYLLAELTGKGEAVQCGASRATKGKIQSEGIWATHDDWANAQSVNDATLQYMRFFEQPGSKSSLGQRQQDAQKYYDMFAGKERPTAGGEGWSTQGVSCPHYYQGGQSWSSYPYNYGRGKTIADGGCGACALAMAVSGLTRTEVTPLEIVKYLNSIGKNTVNNGAGSASAVAQKYGLTYSQISRNNKAAVDQALDSGKCLVFSINANGIYTGGGHFIMCYGRSGNNYFVLESGRYYTMDRGYAYNQVFTPGNQGVFVLGK